MSFASMKKNRMSFDELSSKLEDAGGNTKKNYGDERIWYPKLDDNKNGYAVIRFLPTSENDDLPFVKLFSHGFKGKTGQWYFENCPTTLGNDCPVCQANCVIVESYGGWDSTPKAVKDGDIRNRKRKMSYYSNIYIVDDPETPTNNGKVFLFRYGKKIFDKLMHATNPEFKDETPIQPFDMWEGANFKLKIRQVDGQINYDSSSFDSVSQFLAEEGDMADVYSKQYTLKDLIAVDQFKGEAEMSKRFNRVEGDNGAGAKSISAETIDEVPIDKVAEKPKFKSTESDIKEETIEVSDVSATAESEDDDAMAYFKDLANS